MTMNLVQHRAQPSIWDRAESQLEVDIERWMAAVLAGAFLVSGFRRRTPAGFALAVAGGALAWWAASAVEVRRGHRGRVRAAWPRSADDDLIHETSEESFPASDAPSWTPSTGNATGPHSPR
jgi:hypothetical protein